MEPNEIVEKIDSVFTELAEETKIPKEQLAKKYYLERLGTKPEVKTPTSVADFKEMLITKSMAQMMESMGGEKGATKEVENLSSFIGPLILMRLLPAEKGETGEGRSTMDKLLEYKAMKDLLREPMAEVAAKTAAEKGEWDTVKQIQEDMEKKQKERMDRIERMLSDKKTKDEIAEIKKLIIEKKADEGIEKLRSTLDERLKPGERKSLAEELRDNMAAWNALKEFAKATGMTEKQMTTSEGEINWGAIADKVLDTVKTFAERMPVQPPQQQEFVEMPLTGEVMPGEGILEEAEQGEPTGEAAELEQAEQGEVAGEAAEIEQGEVLLKGEPPSPDRQEAATPEKEKHVCPEPGCGFEAENKAGLLSHIRAKHPTKVNNSAPKSTTDDTTDSQPGGKRA